MYDIVSRNNLTLTCKEANFFAYFMPRPLQLPLLLVQQPQPTFGITTTPLLFLVKFPSHLQYLQSLQGTLTNFCPGTLFFTLHCLSIVCPLGVNFCSLVCHYCDKSTVSWWLVVLVDVLSGIQCKPYGLNVILFICLHLFCMARRLSSMDNSSLHYHHCTTKTLLITIALHGPRDVESWNYA